MIARCLVFLLVVNLSGPAWAADKIVSQSPQQIQLSYAPVVRRAAPAVVNIFTREPEPASAAPLKNNPNYRRYLGDEDETAQTPLGSGVLVDPTGTIVTNEHVIHEAGQLTVVLNDRRQFDATVIRADERTDLAVLKINTGADPLPYLEIRDSDELEVGDIVLAIGNPFGVGQTVTNGIVSALARTVNGLASERTFIQTDAAINPGNSGGALVSLDGKLVGINTALYSEGGGSIGIGFAIPTILVRAVLAQPTTGRTLAHPWLGASGHSVTVGAARRLGLPRVSGVVIDDIVPNGPAANAGLAAGDVVLSIDGKPVDDDEALHFRFATMPVGSVARFGIWHHGQPGEVKISLIAPPEVPPRNVTPIKSSWLSGVTVANLSPALADELQVEDTSGIIVLDVPRVAPAARQRLKVGDIIEAVNGQPVATVGDLQQALAHAGAVAKIGVSRDGRMMQITGPSG